MDLKYFVLDLLVKVSKFEGVEDIIERMERNVLDILIERFILLRFGEIGGGESWDFLMEGGCRDLFELLIIDDELDDIV